jgi:hypothetical protein
MWFAAMKNKNEQGECMATSNEALALAARGFHVFPIVGWQGTGEADDGKRPAVSEWQHKATRDVEQITKWFSGRDYNIGIATSRFGDDKALIVVDVDVKNGKDGNAEIFSLEMQGQELPVTLEQSTPNGGRHIIYIADQACKQGVDVLGKGLDIRSRGGYIVGPGSAIDGKKYRQINGHGNMAPAPAWLVDRLGSARNVEPRAGVVLDGVDADRAGARALEYLKTAPTEGDPDAYPVACKLKDFGVAEQDAVRLLQEHWDPRCVPPRTDDTETVVRNAYRYGKEPQGSTAPEAVFGEAEPDAGEDDKDHPADELNKTYAFIQSGAFVLQETTDEKGRFATKHLSPNDMHAWFTNKTVLIGDKRLSLSRLWMGRPSRREFESVVFAPQKNPGPRWYNLWQGFTVEPAATADHPAVAAFREHALHNVCAGDTVLCQWLMGFFAHMIQRPWEKPLVALVFQGLKGTGKNALLERVGNLLGQHFMVADDDRYLMGNFNSHLESNLFFVLDEASWAGDKRAEGKLKGLITGGQHNIERKGAEPYRVDNLTRVAIIGNEEWLVPVGIDERRYAVFTVGAGRRQDREFFHNMRVGMEQGGYACLLRFLLDFDLSTVDVNAAPQTKGLVDQKHAGLEPVQEWWLDCLSADRLVGDHFDGALPERIPTNRLQAAFQAWAKTRNIRSRLPKDRDFTKAMTAKLGKYRRTREGDALLYAYHSPGIDVLRAEWETFIGGAVDWNN